MQHTNDNELMKIMNITTGAKCGKVSLGTLQLFGGIDDAYENKKS